MTTTTASKARKAGWPLMKGIWRNLYVNDLGRPGPGHEAPHECTILGDGTWLGRGRWPSREVSEQKAIKNLERNAAIGRPGCYTWLGSMFLPDRDDKGLPRSDQIGRPVTSHQDVLHRSERSVVTFL